VVSIHQRNLIKIVTAVRFSESPMNNKVMGKELKKNIEAIAH
jgi:hypothetical protein